MSKAATNALVGVVVIVILVAAGYWFGWGRDGKEISSFEECAAAGYPIMESYPEQCRTPDGQTFVRDISGVPTPEDTGVFCTQDAQECPDGSYVGRGGPNCEFAPCPGN